MEGIVLMCMAWKGRVGMCGPSTANLLQEIGTELDYKGIASTSGADGWFLTKSMLPDSTALPDKVVALIETPGEPPDARNDLDKPHFQVVVRGDPINQVSSAYEEASAKAKEIKRDLHTIGPATLRGRYYPAMWAMQDPFLLEYDKNDRPTFVMNVRAFRSRT